MTEVLPDVVRARLVGLVADALGRMDADALPAPLRRVASFAPARRARLAAGQIASVLAADDRFRERVAVHVRTEVPEAARALETTGEDGDAVPQVDAVDLAALAYLLRPDGWEEVVASAAAAQAEAPAAGEDPARDRSERLERRLEAAEQQLGEARRRHREQVDDLKAQNADLRRKLGEARARVRAAEVEAGTARSAAEEAVRLAGAATAERDADVRRLRSQVGRLESRLAEVRRTDRTGRDTETMRARLLLDTLLETAQGLRRELALPAVEGAPADAVEATVAEVGARASSGHGSLSNDDPALLQELLALPRAHLVVDGYNVTKLAWPVLPLERQRERLLTGLAPIAARSGAEVTVVFDAGATTDRPVVNRPRGVRVVFSPPGVIADDVIRDLVAAEPRGRPVVVVSSDGEVVRDVSRAGARPVASAALTRLLARA